MQARSSLCNLAEVIQLFHSLLPTPPPLGLGPFRRFIAAKFSIKPLSLFFFSSGIVVGVFYLCWIPFMIAVVLSAFCKDLVTPVVVLVISALIYSNSAMNPVLYGFLNRNFRAAFKRLLSKLFSGCPYRITFTHQQMSYDLSHLSSTQKSYTLSIRSRAIDRN